MFERRIDEVLKEDAPADSLDIVALTCDLIESLKFPDNPTLSITKFEPCANVQGTPQRVDMEAFNAAPERRVIEQKLLKAMLVTRKHVKPLCGMALHLRIGSINV